MNKPEEQSILKMLTIKDVFFFIILVVLTIAFYNIIEPFIIDIFLAIVMLVLFRKPYNYLYKKFKNRPTLAAALTILFAILVMFLPIVLIGVMITREATIMYDYVKNNWPEIQANLQPDTLKSYLHDIPYVGEYLSTIDINDFRSNIEDIVAKITQFSLMLVQNTFMNITYMVMHFFIVLFLMFYLLVDGHKFLYKIMHVVPMATQDEKELLQRLEKVTDALVVNTFMIALGEGIYSAILLAICGVPSPIFWGTLIVFLSILPMVGANTVLLPIVIVQFLLGNYIAAFAILILGSGLILFFENVIRNRIDGDKSGMHPALIFVSCMGGIIWLGIVGFLAGPIIAALFTVIWNQFGKNYIKYITPVKETETLHVVTQPPLQPEVVAEKKDEKKE